MFKELNILKVFLEDPYRGFNVREIARILKIAPATASKKLKNFAKKGLLKEKKDRTYNLYKANVDSDAYRDIKVFYNINKLKNSGIIESLNKYYVKPTIILYGSASDGFDTKDSDIDLVIISEKISEFPELKKFEKKLNKEIQIFNIKNLKDLKNEHLINNVLNGIVLQGKIKWI